MVKVKMKIQGKPQMDRVELELDERMSPSNSSNTINRLDAPQVGTIYGVILNYQTAIEKYADVFTQLPYKKPPEGPVLYIKPRNTYIGPNMGIPMPYGVEELEIGACLGVVIGKKATRINKTDAMNYVEGFTIVNDVSIPHESLFRPAVKYKARDGFCPIGPWIVERDAIKNPNRLSIKVIINQEIKQTLSTSTLIRPIEQLLADVTEFMTLSEGDVLLVGLPDDPPLAKLGDRIQIEIEGIGILENTMICEERPIEGGNL